MFPVTVTMFRIGLEAESVQSPGRHELHVLVSGVKFPSVQGGRQRPCNIRVTGRDDPAQ